MNKVEKTSSLSVISLLAVIMLTSALIKSGSLFNEVSIETLIECAPSQSGFNSKTLSMFLSESSWLPMDSSALDFS
ncbi:hypothetical protein D3C76_1639770 [compost metagenome]